MKKLKYSSFFLLWILLFYGVFTIDGKSFNPFVWEYITGAHFIFYGVLVNIVLTAFYYINDNFKLNK